MDEKPDQIMSHIESQRDQLGRNLNELESRVKGATDWRLQFDKNPMLMMGVALGGGLLLGSVVGGAVNKKSSRSDSSWSSSRSQPSYATGSGASNLSSAGSSSASSTSSPAMREQRKKANDTLEHMKAALIGFATAKVKEFMSEALPGFNLHLDEAEKKNAAQQSSGYGSGSYGNQATTRTEQSSNSPYAQQGASQNVGLGV